MSCLSVERLNEMTMTLSTPWKEEKMSNFRVSSVVSFSPFTHVFYFRSFFSIIGRYCKITGNHSFFFFSSEIGRARPMLSCCTPITFPFGRASLSVIISVNNYRVTVCRCVFVSLNDTRPARDHYYFDYDRTTFIGGRQGCMFVIYACPRWIFFGKTVG